MLGWTHISDWVATARSALLTRFRRWGLESIALLFRTIAGSSSLPWWDLVRGVLCLERQRARIQP